MAKIDFNAILADSMKDMTDRSKEVVSRRFGFGGKKPQTLNAIGEHFNITRERVRQIVQASIMQVQGLDNSAYIAAQKMITDHIRKKGGIVHIDRLISHFVQEHNVSAEEFRFYIAASEDVDLIEKHKVYPVESAVHLKDFDFDKWHGVHKGLVDHFEDKQYICAHDDLYAIVKKQHKNLDSIHAHEHIHVSSEIKKNPFGKWGLQTWNDVTPKSIRDKVYLILGHVGEPLHFREIAEAIDEHGLGRGKRKTHPQTVHNELIKDDRFVLIGRGTYTLQDDDYVTGSVKDIIKHILDENPEPMTAQAIIDTVLEHRDVKPSTIKINLHAIAKKDGQTYTLK